ncbi:MAG: NADP-dependent oxidoreductase [Pelagibacterium sp. SCN 64-44]|nr:MAG: NADP-dependent oxidoreductase [Pelagibacterium sp. SCN 64-44]
MTRLGRSGLTVSRLALGTMTFGDRTDEAEAQRIFSEAVDCGVNFIDTADSYAQGRSEEITGRLLAGRRDGFVLATKLANPIGEGPNRRGLSRKWIVEELENSLQRLGTDYVDILYLHKEDPKTPLEETARAIADLRRAGKLRYFGVSNFRAWRIARLAELCAREGVDGPVVNQPLYHILNRTAEVEQFPACEAYGIGITVYSPTARGILTGKYAPNTPPPSDSRGAGNKRMAETEYQPENIEAAAKVVAWANSRGMDPVPFAMAWVLANPLVSAAIAGPRTIEQWRSYRAAFDCDIMPTDEAAINALVKPGTTAIHQFSDPAYPPEGRPVVTA